MIGLVGERRSTSLKRAFLNAAGTPIQTNASGIDPFRGPTE